MRKFIRKVNVVRPLCNHLIGKDHAFCHRAIIGLFIMAGGVIIAKTLGHHEIFYIALFADTIGYGLHGIGLLPYAEALIGEIE